MDEYTPEQLREALRPIASLIGKSEKAQLKLAPGTWQHAMLGDNLRALHLATALMTADTNEGADAAPEDLRCALRAIASMIDRTEKVRGRFSPGTAQHTLLRNRLSALRVAEAVTRAQLEKG